ncbi:SRPBCC family protein [Streptomyces johnsoniae]|uniref:SRPBCC domain-containing protein n=1 Tax=Streptomyces johnsoniae TaxID=3075532 RepID=A0ABU2S812_9ACTN|nr:SRPBCC domain-containing protein [Streptomyces sp. DSM 41886]MDT0445078.1 SRPBCC domain-containing protein [Streptomyces sp. DSM 41886]
MEHEVFLPYSAEAVRSALAAPDRVVRCVPGLQLEPGADPAAPEGRLRVRIGSSSITYRGSMSVTARGDRLTVEAQGAEARGAGEAALMLSVVPREVEDGSGTALTFHGTVEGKGRIGTFDAGQRQAAGRRLLDRFAEALAEELARADEPAPAAGGIGEPDDNERVIPGIPSAPEPEPGPGAGPGRTARAGGNETGAGAESDHDAAFDAVLGAEPGLGRDPDADAGPGSDRGFDGGDLDADLDADLDSDLGAGLDSGPDRDFDPGLDDEEDLPVHEPEADFARRTMIGRSAEEVDHAPPRGRYAPEPTPGGAPGPAAALRWAAPAAALAVATAVVLTRAIRRRR